MAGNVQIVCLPRGDGTFGEVTVLVWRGAAAQLPQRLAFDAWRAALTDEDLLVTDEAPVLRVAVGAHTRAALLDVVDLARIVMPGLREYTATAIAAAVGAEPDASSAGGAPPAPVAGGDVGRCLALRRAWEVVVAAAEALSPVVLGEVAHLFTAWRQHPGAVFMRWVEERNPGAGRRRRLRYEDLFLEQDLPRARREVPGPEQYQPVDVDEVGHLLGPGGPFVQGLRGYEHREQQVQMAQAVTLAFNESKHLVVEAGTGVGKSLAYLLPAVLWARRNRTPVVVSTYTRNLQSQLFAKDIPLLRRATGLEINATVIKGRRNYLCLRKLLFLLRHVAAEAEREELPRLAAAVVWAVRTATGDLAETGIGEEPGTQGLAAKLTSAREECRGQDCAHRSVCFLYRARRRALAADVIVANHALVFAELGLNSVVLPPYGQVIFDEAHNLEEAASVWLSRELAPSQARYLVSRLWREGRRGKGTGVIPAVLRQVEAGALGGGDAERQALRSLAHDAVMAVTALGGPLEAFFAQLGRATGGGAGETAAGGVRVRPEVRDGAAWQAVRAAWTGLREAFARVRAAADGLAKKLEQLTAGTLFDRLDFIQELAAAVAQLDELIGTGEFVLAADDAGFAYWVDRGGGGAGGTARACAAPVFVGEKLATALFEQKQSVVLTSATLTVRGTTEYLRHRLGIDRLKVERIQELTVGTAFDYAAQCAVLVPTFLPEPDERGADYAAELGRLLIDVFRRTRGRGMALFTSYDMLRRTAAVLQEGLRGSPIPVLAQGISGSRERITETFREDIASVLLGTHSFWEGVDVGESLSCLVVARLPFAVFTDPVIEARCEQVRAEGGDAFRDFSLPSAVIRLRQGFGRLIRHRSDRGVVIIADRRIVTKFYGRWFRESLPTRVLAVGDRGQFLDAVAQFLDGLEPA